MKSAALVSAGAVAGLGGLSQFSRWATAAGSNRQGAWASELGQRLAEWPLIPLHAALLGDGRLLTYGTGGPTGTGQQTGYFIYDIWDPNAGANSHLTLAEQYPDRHLLQCPDPSAAERECPHCRRRQLGRQVGTAAYDQHGKQQLNIFTRAPRATIG